MSTTRTRALVVSLVVDPVLINPISLQAFEFASSLLRVAASVTLVGRSNGRLRLAYETHYPVCSPSDLKKKVYLTNKCVISSCSYVG